MFNKKKSAYDKFGKMVTYKKPVDSWDKIRRIKEENDYSVTKLLGFARRVKGA